MVTVVGFVVGGLAATVLWKLSSSAFGAEVFLTENYRGRTLSTAVGVLLVLVATSAHALVALTAAAGVDIDPDVTTGLHLTTVAALGFGLLGLLDDLGGVGQSGGFTTHLRALAAGRLTTGTIKLFGGAAVALVVVFGREPGTLSRVLADGALVALAANLGNLFDRRPGRVVKVTLVAFMALVTAVGARGDLVGVALIVGAGAGLFMADLRERLMLGDAGANVLGAALGLGVVLTCSPGVRTVVLVAVAALNLASERVSFTRIIDATPPLRAADRWGREP